MLNQQQLPPTAQPPHPAPQSFRERINQLKAKVKPSLILVPVQPDKPVPLPMDVAAFSHPHGQHVHTNVSIIENLYEQSIEVADGQAMDECKQPCNIKSAAKLVTATSITKTNYQAGERSLSETKIVQMRVSYRKSSQFIKVRKIKQSLKEAGLEKDPQFNRFKLNKVGTKHSTNMNTNRESNKQNDGEHNKQGKVQGNHFQIQDILINTYKSPRKTEQLAGNSKQSESNTNAKGGKQKKMSINIQNININIDVRGCSSRTHGHAYTLTDNPATRRHPHGKGGKSGRHTKNSTMYRIK